MICEMIFTHIHMESVILNNCAIIDVDMKHIVLFCFVTALFSQDQSNAGQVGYIPLGRQGRQGQRGQQGR